MLPFACWAQGQQTSPAWFNQPQFFATDYPYQFPFQSPLSPLPFTGQVWGVYILDNTFPDSYVQDTVDSWHAQGGLYFFVEDLYARFNIVPDWDFFRMRNLAGAYIDLGGFYAPENTPLYSLSSPVYQQALLAGALQAVDLGADGMTFDNSVEQLDIMLGAPDQSGSFDSVTMAAFQSYLQQNFTASQLMSQFGISNIGSFNYAAYITANNLTQTWNQSPLTGLARQFYLFKRQEELNFLRNMISTTRQYAQQKYGRNFLFDFNGNDSPEAYFLNDIMDFENDESPYIRGGDHPFRGVDTKAWKGWKSPNIVYPSAMAASWGPSAAPYLSGPTVNLERVLIADIYAAGGIRACSIDENMSDGTPEPVDLSVVNLYANFILNNPRLMTQTTTHAQTLLLQSASSLLGTLAASAEATPGEGYTDYIGTGRLLLDSGINYDSLFVPDTSYSQLPPLTLAALTPYKVVIAPYSWALDDNQVSVLLAYAQQGGALVIDGHFANSQPDGTPASRSNVQTILATQGARPYGSGTIVVTSAQYGVQYQSSQYVSNSISAQANIQAAFVSFLAPYVSPTVVVTQPPPQIHQPGVGAFFYRDVNGHALVHLVNYDYNDSNDQFVTKTNIQVQVDVGSQPVNAVILRSPDIVGTQSLPFTTTNGTTVTVTVPQIYAWDVLYFETSTLPPVISSTAPAATLGAAGGDSLTFSVQASDADGNPLTYTWSVNGQALANVLTPSYTLQLPVTASGVYTITVSVTDGARVTEYSWTIGVKGSNLPTVLFDETHGENFTIDAATAAMIDPGVPAFPSLAMLAQAMQPLYRTSRLTAGSITAQSLSGVAALVLPAPNDPLSGSEAAAILSFVQNGGGLIFASYRGLDASINSLLGPLGINVDNTELLAPAGNGFFASSFANSPALPPNPAYYTNGGGSLLAAPPAVSLVSTNAEAWKSISGQPAQQPGDPNGPFTLIAAAQVGNGRVFVVNSVTSFCDEWLMLGIQPNISIFLSGLAWVSAPGNPVPPPSSPSNSSISLSAGKANFAYTVGGSAPATQTVNISNAGGGTLAWSASSNSPWLTVSPASGMGAGTLTLGINTAALSAQTYNGEIAVTAAGAANSPQTIFVALSVSAPPVVVAGVANSASYAAGPIAPGELVTIAGSMLGPSKGVAGGVDPSTGKMVTQLAGASVTFNGVAAPLLYVSATQINAIVPDEVAGCTQAMLQVQFQGASSPGTSLPCATAAPGLFTLSATGSGQAAAANQDGALNGPSSPAAAGSYMTLYFTGGGQTNPPGVTGSITGTSVLKWLTQTATVTVGGVAATVAFDGAAPTFIDGFLQLNIQLSPNTPSGNAQPVVVTVGNVSSQAAVTLAVQ